MAMESPVFSYAFVEGLDEELKSELEEIYGIKELDVEDVFTDTQLAKIEQRPDYLYVALQFPEYEKSKRQFALKEVHCFLSEKFLMIIDKHHFKHAKQFNNLRDHLVEDDEATSFVVFYEMLDFFCTKAYRVLNKFKSEIGQIEADLFDFDTEEDLLQEILIIKRNLINFENIIRPLERVIVDLETKYIKFVNQKGVEFLDDSLDKIKKIVNNLQNYKEQMNLLTETNESLIARSTNETIKALTAINLIVLVPTIITSFFGMNVFFGWDPAAPSLHEIIGITLFVILSTLAIFIYFKRKRWI
ncbi:MAG: magnesium/cobalt transporter CorA [Patescibacteria group bacterium]